MYKKPLPELIDYRYKDRGGWEGLIALFNAPLPYDTKLTNVKDQYVVSRDTASKWYATYKKMNTL